MLPTTVSVLTSRWQATPRSLRTFLDTAPFAVLDTPLSDLLFVSKAANDNLLAELELLRTEQSAKQESNYNSHSDGHYSASDIDIEVQKAQIEALETKNLQLETRNRTLEASNGALNNSVKEVEMKCRALKSEVSKLRRQLVAAETAKQGNRLEVEALRDIEARAKDLFAQHERQRAENEKLLEEKTEFVKQRIAFEDAQAAWVKEKAALQSDHAALNKHFSGTMIQLGRFEEENKMLRSKDADMVDQNGLLQTQKSQLTEQTGQLEHQNEKLTKEKLALEIDVDRLRDEIDAARKEAEARKQEKMVSPTQAKVQTNAAEDLRNRLNLESKVSNLTSRYNELETRFDSLREQQRATAEENVVLTRQSITMKDRILENGIAQEQQEKQHLSALDRLRRECNDLRTKCRQYEDEIKRYRGNTAPLTPKDESASMFGGSRSPVSITAHSASSSQAPGLPRGFKRIQVSADSPTDKRQKLNGSSLNETETGHVIRAQSKRSGAVYLVRVPPVGRQELLDKLSKQAEVEGLRRVIQSAPNHYGAIDSREIEQWVVKYTAPPREFKKHIEIRHQVYATQLTGSGGLCMICDKNHHIWDCDYFERQINVKINEPFTNGASSGFRERTLFDRIHPPVDRAAQAAQVDELVDSTNTDSRTLLCRFKNCPFQVTEDRLLGVVSGGPIDSCKVMDNKDIGYINFVHPEDAKRFAEFAARHINEKVSLGRPDEHGYRGRVSFSYKEDAARAMDQKTAEGIIVSGWSRVIFIKSVPNNVTLRDIHDNLERGFFILNEAESNTGSPDGCRDVKIEFVDIRDAVRCFRDIKRFDTHTTGGKGIWGSGVEFGQDPCARELCIRQDY